MYEAEIEKLKEELARLQEQSEINRQKKISSRTAFYESEARKFGKIMEQVYLLEMIDCRATPVNLTREKLMLDFFEYSLEGGLDRALDYVNRIR